MPRFRTRAVAAAAALALSTAGLLAAAVPASAAPLVPTDAALLGCLNQTLGLPPANGEFTQEQLDSVVSLTCSNAGVQTLDGISSLTKLAELYIDGSEISDLTPLTGMSTLSKLSITDAKVSDLTPLATTRVWYLWLAGNEITDISPLREIGPLEWYSARINLDRNHIVDGTVLRYFAAADELSVSDQTAVLPDVAAGTPFTNPFLWDGYPVDAVVDGAAYDAETASWTYPVGGTFSGTWGDPALWGFSGTFVQTVIGAPVEPEVPLEPEVPVEPEVPGAPLPTSPTSPTAPQAPVTPATAGNALASTGTAVAPMFVGALTILAGGIASLIAVGFLRRRTEGADTSS